MFAMVDVCVTGRWTVDHQEAVQEAKQDLPSWQAGRGPGHVHEDRQGLRGV